MPLQAGETAPYAPPKTVIDVITRYRDRGLAKPFTQEVLARAGVSGTLTARVLQSLKLLDLVDDSGYPSEPLEDLARASQEEFKERFAAMIRAIYADVFAFADPSTDDPDRIRDAFRSYNPRGQQERMVTLFLGLCEFAGIVSEVPKRPVGPRRSEPRATRASTSRNAGSGGAATTRKRRSSPALDFARPSDRMPQMILALLAELPEAGGQLTDADRARFKTMFGTLLDYYYPVQAMVDSTQPTEETGNGEE
jgi:Family of unknown function (DUF5343)